MSDEMKRALMFLVGALMTALVVGYYLGKLTCQSAH